MKYFFIYSAGGGAGDWNGLKRVWKEKMPERLKKRVLLKFGDVFYNHSPISSLIKPVLWSRISNMRQWLQENVNDSYIHNESIILLDSGTSKIVNYITTNHEDYSVQEIVKKFVELIEKNKIIQKYVNIINNSNIQEAVTLDIPNPFKIRTQSKNTRTRVFNNHNSHILIKVSANLTNQMFRLLGDNQEKILTTINGLWSDKEIDLFFSLLDYKPDKLAIGGLTRTLGSISEILKRLDKKLNLHSYKRVHFLGCGGLKISAKIKEIIKNNKSFSVDNSTSWNRAIDGNTSGSSQSGYFDYASKRMFRVKLQSINQILNLHSQAKNPIFNLKEMKDILDKILQHQSNKSSLETYEARALLAIHNHDVFRLNAE